jgi:MFS family permease
VRDNLAFIQRQQRDWKITVARTSIDKLAYQLVYPYLSIYVVALGATGTQLGAVNTIGMVVAGLAAPFTGWLIDRFGAKRMYLLGIGLVAVAYLVYAVAQSWVLAILAMAAYWLGSTGSVQSCATVCGNCLDNKDRATGMLFCETIAAGLVGMVGPILAAWLVTSLGGVSLDTIRPLFFLALLCTAGSFILVLKSLSDRRWSGGAESRGAMFQGFARIFKEGRNLKKWLVIGTLSSLPMGMVLPFAQVFANQQKGADGLVLGAMVTGAAVASIIFAIPLGRWADRVGRKKVLYITMPVFWASNLLLVWAPGPGWLIIAGVLQGGYYIGSSIVAAMERELVPKHQMARWLGLARFFKLMIVAGMALAAGAVWDMAGPMWVFLIYVALDLLVRLPLLIRMPETLSIQHDKGENA